ncbi:hypothetical protein, partial [Oleiphilus sp. HI0128]
VLLWVGIFAFIFSRIKLSFPVNIFSKLPLIFENNFFTIVTGLVFLPLAVKFNADFGISFRYSGEQLSQSGVLPQVITLYKSFFVGFVTYCFILSLGKRELAPLCRLSLALHMVNWILCANGAVDVVWIFTALLIAAKGNNVDKYLLIGSSGTNFFKTISVVLLSAAAVTGVVFFGYANKMGFEQAYLIFRDEFTGRVVYYLYYRLVVFTSSLDLILQQGFDLRANLLALELELDIFVYRLGKIIGFLYPRPEIEGINRLNYLSLYKYPIQDRAGATPGPLASFGYIPMMPLNFVLCGFYIAVVRNTYKKVFWLPKGCQPSMLSCLIFVLIGYTFLHNPISAFTKIGPELFKTLFFIYVFGMALRRARRENERVV